jgi:drug/metabolite transporter (DMT)-like permease
MSLVRQPARHTNPWAGIAYVSAGIFFLTCSDALAKWVGQYYSPIQILFLRSLLALPVVVVVVMAIGGRRALYTAHGGIHLVRGAINVISASFFYLGLQALPLAETTAIAFSAPLFVTALSVWVLKEKVDRKRWLAVAAGFAGVLIIVQPGGSSFQMAALYPLATAALYAIMMLTARAIGAAESAITTMLYIVLGQLVFSSIAMPIFWEPVTLSHFPFFAGIALCSTLGLSFITQGFRIGPASVVAPFDYTGLLWATLLGWWLWQETPGMQDALGAAFIVGSGLYIAWRATRGRKKRA